MRQYAPVLLLLMAAAPSPDAGPTPTYLPALALPGGSVARSPSFDTRTASTKSARPHALAPKPLSSRVVTTLVPPALAPRPAPPTGPSYEPAPMPDSDYRGPQADAAQPETHISPALFNTATQYRGDGFSPHSTAQDAQEKNFKPGAGFNLKVPLQ